MPAPTSPTALPSPAGEPLRCPACVRLVTQVTVERQSFTYGTGPEAVTLHADVPVCTCACGERFCTALAERARDQAVRHALIRAAREGQALAGVLAPVAVPLEGEVTLSLSAPTGGGYCWLIEDDDLGVVLGSSTSRAVTPSDDDDGAPRPDDPCDTCGRPRAAHPVAHTTRFTCQFVCRPDGRPWRAPGALRIGGPTHGVTLRGVRPGDWTVGLVLRRPWEPVSDPLARAAVRVRVG